MSNAKATTRQQKSRVAIDRFYDSRMFDGLVDLYYGGSGFLNFGYWTDETCSPREASEALMQRLLGRIPGPRHAILDVACGVGATTHHVQRQFPEAVVVGINISVPQMQAGTRRATGCVFAGMDAVRLAFADESFDAVVCVEAAFHFRTRHRFLREAHRVLRPGGVLVLSDVILSPSSRFQRPGWDPANYVEHPEAYAALCSDAGFSDVQIEDATESCWTAGFWSVVRFTHQRFLDGEIRRDQLNGFLERVYRLAGDLESYILASAVKPARVSTSSRRVPARAPGRSTEDHTELGPTGERVARPFVVDEDYRRKARDYDSLMYWPALLEYYGHSDFVNFGYWREKTRDAREASETLVQQLLDWIPDKSGNLLDVACGKGASTRYLRRDYAPEALTGVNISGRQLETCRANAPGSRFLSMDAVRLAFREASFDNILCVEAAFHFETRERFLREAFRVLKPGGRLVLSDILLTRGGEARRPGRHVENYLPGPDAYETLAREVGFRGVEVVDATQPCFVGGFWHLVRFSHERLLTRQMDADALRAFLRHFFLFVPEMRFYLLACMRKP